MKNLIAIVMIFSSLVLVSCGPTSKKGAWTDADKERYQKEMETVDLSNLGEYKQQWLDCYYKKLEANFESFDDANLDEATCEKLALECNDEVVPISKKGDWCDADKKLFDEAMASANLDELGELKQQYVDCYFSKVQENYASFAEADQDAEGCEKLAEGCAESLVK